MSDELPEAIRAHAERIHLPSGEEGDTIGITPVAEIAHSLKISGVGVEAEAIRMDVFPTRYLRNRESISATDQLTLLESSIAMVGLGGLGGNLLEMFMRTGVGNIRAADGDAFEESNLNRQLLSSINTFGIPKADVAIGRAHQINPSINIETWDEYLNPSTLPEFLSSADVAIDALGGLKLRLALQQAAAEANIPLVTGALAGWTGYVGVVEPGQPGPANLMGRDNAAEEKLGCPAPAVTLVASLMAVEAVKLLSGAPSNLSGAMLIIDLQTLTFEKVSL
ncbi:MAG: ThiF family adenylyltransferase [Pseudodesulfovibrio sp.]